MKESSVVMLALALSPFMFMLGVAARDYWRDFLPGRPLRVRLPILIANLICAVIAFVGIMLMIWVILTAL